MDNDTLTQDAAIKLVESIGETLHLTRHDDKMGVSYYGISDNTVVRLSDHSTYLQTWIDYNSYSADNKYSIVIEVNPSKPNPIVNQDISFFVTEFKHKQKRLDDESVLALANAIKGALGPGCQFSNPFHVSPKLIMSKYKPVSRETNESKIYNNMKNVKLIKESQLRAIVAESVRRVLREKSENDWRQYAEKAIQCAQRGDYENASKYDNLAASALKGKYGLGDSQFETNFDDYKGKQQYYRSRSLGSHNPYDGIPVDTYSKSLDGNSKRNWKRTSGLLPTNAENDLNDYFSN